MDLSRILEIAHLWIKNYFADWGVFIGSVVLISVAFFLVMMVMILLECLKYSRGYKTFDDWFNLGEKSRMAGDYNAAMNAYETVISLNASHQTAYEALGKICFSLGRYEKSVNAFQELIKRQPYNPCNYYSLVESLIKMGRSQQARETLLEAVDFMKKLIREYPRYFAYYVFMAGFLRKLGKNREAETLLQAALQGRKKSASSPSEQYFRGVLHMELQEYAEAAEALAAAVKSPENFKFLCGENSLGIIYDRLGISYFHLKNFPEALAAFENAIREQPKDSTACYYLGLTCLELGLKEKALEHLQNALRFDPRDVHSRVWLGFTFGMADEGESTDLAYIGEGSYAHLTNAYVWAIFGQFDHDEVKAKIDQLQTA